MLLKKHLVISFLGPFYPYPSSLFKSNIWSKVSIVRTEIRTERYTVE